jgi:hypothetical protein
MNQVLEAFCPCHHGLLSVARASIAYSPANMRARVDIALLPLLRAAGQ